VVAENEAKNRLSDLKDRIEHGTDFGELARLHSDDPSAARGGDLGWITPGDVVPEFEHAMNALKPGQVSDPFKSPFGWHIVQVLERREQDMSKDRQKLAARQAIRQRKSEEQWQEWERQQRDKTDVEYRLEEKWACVPMRSHRPRRRFGQNFLIDGGCIERIVEAISPHRSDRVIEIGPGLGAMTEPLLQHLDSLHVVEIDRDIVARL